MQFSHDNHESLDDEQIFCEPSQNSVNCFLEDAEIVGIDDCRRFRLSTEDSVQLAYDRMRRRLTYFFMNPIEKWHEKRRFPWKLSVQVIKIIFVTWQIMLFGLRSHGFVQQHRDATIALSHIFLLDWVHDFAVYPPSSGPYAVYTIPEFYNNIDNVVKQYGKLPTLALGSFSYDASSNGSVPPLELCITHYKSSGTYLFSKNAFISSSTVKNCFHLPMADDKFSMEEFLKSSNHTINFSTLVKAKISFKLKTAILKAMSKLDIPDCYRLHITVTYDNKPHDGQIKIALAITSDRLECEFNVEFVDTSEKTSYALRQLLNSIVIIFCFCSVILCVRSLLSGQKLCREATEFFVKYYNRVMPISERLDFVDFWYVMIVLSDSLIVAGSIIKLKIEEKSHNDWLYMHCTFLLGVGNLLVWVGLLRYLGFFKKYNMLILTLKRALPNVLRFLLCAILLYAGFCFCGWIVLGPYHIKFQSLSRTSECLFSVMNGDDMFNTFALTDSDNLLIWWFSRVYLYLFLVLFIYVVVSLFISVIMDTFETIKGIYVHGSPPETTVELFLSSALSVPEPVLTPTSTSSPKTEEDTEAKAITVIKALFTEIRRQLNRRQSS